MTMTDALLDQSGSDEFDTEPLVQVERAELNSSSIANV